MKKQFIVAGIGTEIGKTFISSVLVEALQADYWKPIQSGGLDFSDTDTVKSLVSIKNNTFFQKPIASMNHCLHMQPQPWMALLLSCQKYSCQSLNET
jgi:dethiobiotin synthetase